jgi:hypothetical protein
MAIAANRFQVLDKETNVANSSFLNLGKEISNSPFNAAAEDIGDALSSMLESMNMEMPTFDIEDLKIPTIDLTADTKEMASMLNDALSSLGNSDKLLSSIGDTLKDVGSGFLDSLTSGLGGLSDIKSATREVAGLVSSVTDLTKLKDGAIESVLGEMGITDPGILNMLKNMVKTCPGANGMGMNGCGLPTLPKLNCNGNDMSVGSGNCQAQGFSDLLNKLTGGLFGGIFSDVNAMLKKIMGLANYGYSLGMCGVLASVAKGADLTTLSKAGAGLLSITSNTQNANAFLDISKNMVDAFPLVYNPGAVGENLANFILPSGLKNSEYSSYNDQIMAATELYDDSFWSDNGGLTIGKVNGYNESLSSIMRASNSNNSCSINDLDTFRDDDSVYLYSAYV